MSWASVVAARVLGLFERSRRERELDDEVRHHLELQIEDNVRAGMSPTEARHAALRSFGGVAPMMEEYRERSAFTAVETMVQDVRYALRTLRRSPGFAATSIGVLALAIGANTAMFSVLHAVLLRPLPYRAPEQLAMLWSELPSQSVREGRSSYGRVEQWRQSRGFSDLAVFDPASVMLNSAAGVERLTVIRVSPNLFPMLGIAPVLGRTFTAEEAERRQRLVLISYRFWQMRFGGSSAALGASIELDGIPAQIVGVLAPGTPFPGRESDVWEPHTLAPDWEANRAARGAGAWFVLGRMAPGVTLERAQTEMSAIARRLEEEFPEERNGAISIVPLGRHLTAQSRPVLELLAGAIFCVLLIAATNVASLSLARSCTREREIAIRAALGASRLRIVRQLLAESLTLAVVAGALGLLVASAAIRFVVASQPADMARLDEAGLDPAVLAWAFTLCVLTGTAVGLAPAILAARRQFTPSGQIGARGVSTGGAARRIRRALVASEFAIAIVLLVGAGLLIRSLWSIERVDPGFRTERALLAQLSTATFRPEQRAAFYRDAIQQVESLPGVEGAGFIGDLLIGANPEQAVTLEGEPRAAAGRMRLRRDEVSSGFFKALRVPLLRGRFFTEQDGPGALRVAIVNETMARRLWPGRDPLGRKFELGVGEWFTVAGVVGDMRRQGLEREPVAQMFEPLAQNPSSRLTTLLVRTAADDPRQMLGAVQAAVRRVDKRAPIYGVNTIEGRMAGALRERRFQTSLLAGFSLVALLMAAIGIYGLIQYSIAARTQEIGIRIAIGAQAGAIFRMVIREGLALCLTGLGIGLVGALWLGRAGASLLFGVTATDPATFVAVSALLTAVGTAACYFPARRAMKVDPIVALRQQ